jgi:hypothetical protein
MYRFVSRWFRPRAAGRGPATVRLSVERLERRFLPSQVLLPLAPPGTRESPGVQVAAATIPHVEGSFTIKKTTDKASPSF